jgi:hypothetical protein
MKRFHKPGMKSAALPSSNRKIPRIGFIAGALTRQGRSCSCIQLNNACRSLSAAANGAAGEALGRWAAVATGLNTSGRPAWPALS